MLREVRNNLKGKAIAITYFLIKKIKNELRKIIKKQNLIEHLKQV